MIGMGMVAGRKKKKKKMGKGLLVVNIGVVRRDEAAVAAVMGYRQWCRGRLALVMRWLLGHGQHGCTGGGD